MDLVYQLMVQRNLSATVVSTTMHMFPVDVNSFLSTEILQSVYFHSLSQNYCNAIIFMDIIKVILMCLLVVRINYGRNCELPDHTNCYIKRKNKKDYLLYFQISCVFGCGI